jgi:hypothetical protein
MTTTTQHTPGPWKLEITDTGFRVIYSDSTLRSHIAALHEAALCEEHGDTFANARLIAAAPQMLEALRAALEAMGDTYDARDAAGTEGEQLRDQIAEAIAAATGEPADY